jgi:hypothetical protein
LNEKCVCLFCFAATKVMEGLVDLTKDATPGDVADVNSVRKSMGVVPSASDVPQGVTQEEDDDDSRADDSQAGDEVSQSESGRGPASHATEEEDDDDDEEDDDDEDDDEEEDDNDGNNKKGGSDDDDDEEDDDDDDEDGEVGTEAESSQDASGVKRFFSPRMEETIMDAE